MKGNVLRGLLLIILITAIILFSDGRIVEADNQKANIPDDSQILFSGRISGLPAINPVTIAAGQEHTCALTDWGGVKCWGSNHYGQLGNGTQISSSTPVDVLGLSSGVIAVTAGNGYTCAFTSSGRVKCWGANWLGQLGDGTKELSLIPVDVEGIENGVIGISANNNHTCAVTTDKKVMCWGINEFGQLGDGTKQDQPSPVEVKKILGNAVAVSAGGHHTCALLDSGGVKCWGNNESGQLGDNTRIERGEPAYVNNLLSGVTAISVGEYHSCALMDTGGVKCWGSNSIGELGNGLPDSSYITPEDVINLSDAAVSISSWDRHTCVVMEDYNVKCWGSNWFGQLGDGTTSHQFKPKDVLGLSDQALSVTTGKNHTCVHLASGGIQCWGDNREGQLGNGSSTKYYSPIDVSGISVDVSEISAGGLHTCALLDSGGVKCWGLNESGQIGDGTDTLRSMPVDVHLADPVTMITAGRDHTCAMSASNEIKCWGKNDYGQLGDGTTETRFEPVSLEGLLDTATTIVSHSDHSCVLNDTGGVKCWGSNSFGQLGDEYISYSTSPMAIEGFTEDITTVSPGGNHTCAITSTGGVVCLGDNGGSQLGNEAAGNYSITPVSVEDLSDVNALSAGYYHTCALTNMGGVKCWGTNITGQLGNDQRDNSYTPVDVVGLAEGVAAISAGYEHTCALLSSGVVKCWGNNGNGQLGWGNPDHSPVPVDIVGISETIIAIEAGYWHTCALTESHHVKCWGDNSFRQVGDGLSLTPVDVIWDGNYKSYYFPVLMK